MTSGKYYHIYNRGINREKIFFEEENYLYFLNQFKKYITPFADVLAYCLLPNHFHFFVRIKEESLKPEEERKLSSIQKAFKDFFISYSKSINKRYNRTGALFQYKFKRKEITEIAHYTWLLYYIHQNPIKAGLCKELDQWKFSSYSSLLSNKPTMLVRDEVISWFSTIQAFVEFHQSNINEQIERDQQLTKILF